MFPCDSLAKCIEPSYPDPAPFFLPGAKPVFYSKLTQEKFLFITRIDAVE
jgi:hypothetical protein